MENISFEASTDAEISDYSTSNERKIIIDRTALLGQGGFSTVFRGTWRATDGYKTVAVKRIELQRVDRREEKSLKSLTHENVVKLYDTESDINFRYILIDH